MNFGMFEATPEYDRVLRLAAEQMAQHTIETVRNSLLPGGKMWVAIENGTELYVIVEVQNMLPLERKPSRVEVLVDIVPYAYVDAHGRGTKYKAAAFIGPDPTSDPDYKRFHLAVAVGEISAETTEELASLVTEKFQARFSVIVHEYVHLIDFIRSSGLMGSTPGARYMDDPFEFNAWFQQAAHEFLLKLHDYHGKMKEEPRIASDFAQFWFQAPLYSYSFLRAQAELTGKWARKFRVRLYQFYTHLREMYPTGWSVRPDFDHPKMQERAAEVFNWQKDNDILP